MGLSAALTGLAGLVELAAVVGVVVLAVVVHSVIALFAVVGLAILGQLLAVVTAVLDRLDGRALTPLSDYLSSRRAGPDSS